MVETEDKCICGHNLFWMDKWSDYGGPLVCLNVYCSKYRTPQGTRYKPEMSPVEVRMKEYEEIRIANEQEKIKSLAKKSKVAKSRRGKGQKAKNNIPEADKMMLAELNRETPLFR